MPFDVSILDNPSTRALLVYANLQQNNREDTAGCLRTLEGIFGTVVEFDHVTLNPLCPNFLEFESAEVRCILFGGVKSPTMALNTGGGWTGYGDVDIAHGFNYHAWSVIDRLVWPRILRRAGEEKPWVIVGHSLGGMLAHVFNYRLAVEHGNHAQLVITTGAPRALAYGYDGFYPGSQGFHLSLLSDPVPTLPPRFSEAPQLTLATAGLTLPIQIPAVMEGFFGEGNPPPSLGLWPRFRHCHGHGWISDGGQLLSSSSPPPSPFFFNGTWNTWNLAVEGAMLLPQHELSLYAQAVLLWARDERRLRDKLEAAAEVASSAQEADPAFMLPVDVDREYFLPLLQGVPPVSNPIKTETIPAATGGRSGALYLRGQLIATFPNRHRAQTAARHLNRFLGRLPTALEVSLEGMQVGMAAYLLDASVAKGVDKKPVRISS